MERTITSKKGATVTLRSPTIGDLDEMLRYINDLSREDTYITFSGEVITEEEEMRFLNKTIMDIEDNNAVYLLAFHNNTLIGTSGIERNTTSRKRSKHVGIFGLSISKEYRGDGIGSQLAKTVIAEAKKNIPGLKAILLHVYSPNTTAINLYRKLGFREVGKQPKAILYRGEYVDQIDMWLDL